MKSLSERTILLLAFMGGTLIAIVVLAGAVVTIIHPRALPFHDYATDLSILGAAVIAAIGAAVYRATHGPPPTEPPPATPTTPTLRREPQSTIDPKG